MRYTRLGTLFPFLWQPDADEVFFLKNNSSLSISYNNRKKKVFIAVKNEF